MILCGLDIATVTGLTVYKDGAYDASTYRGTVKKKKGLEGAKDLFLDPTREGEIGKNFEAFLMSYFILHGVTHVAIEAPIPSNPVKRKKVINPNAQWAGQAVEVHESKGTSLAAIYRIYGLSFIAVSVCRRLNIAVFFVAQGTWRKEFLGNGRPYDAKKEAKKMCEKMNIPCSSLDAAESVGICFWLLRSINPNAHRGNELFDQSKTSAEMQARMNAEKLFKKA